MILFFGCTSLSALTRLLGIFRSIGWLYGRSFKTEAHSLPSSPLRLPAARRELESEPDGRAVRAAARLPGGEAASSGSRPSGRAVEYIKEVGYDLTTHTSKSLDQFNGQEVEVAVTMGCGDECPLVRAKRREEWQIPDPKDMPPDQYREVRDLIERKVKELLASL